MQTDDEIRVRASMPWTFILMLIFLGIGVILFQVLDPIFVGLLELLDPWLEGNENAQKGVSSVETAWNLWPLWFLGLIAVFGIVESIRKSNSGVGR